MQKKSMILATVAATAVVAVTMCFLRRKKMAAIRPVSPKSMGTRPGYAFPQSKGLASGEFTL